MKEQRIILSAPMRRAILESRKTQTRLVVKRQEEVVQSGDGVELWTGFMGWEPVSEAVSLCPLGVPGDRLWMQEAFARVPTTAYRCSHGVHQTTDPGDPDMCAVYREGWELSSPGGWRSPVLMPRWASRITLEITGVKVERLQAISEADAVAEGATMRPSCNGFRHANPGWSMDWSRVGEFSRFATAAQRGQKAPLTEGDISLTTARYAFANFFDRIHGRGFWDANPWVWVLDFTKLEAMKCPSSTKNAAVATSRGAMGNPAGMTTTTWPSASSA